MPQSDKASFRASLELAKAGDKAAAERCVATLQLSPASGDDVSVTVQRLYESRAIPVLRSAGITLTQFVTLVRGRCALILSYVVLCRCGVVLSCCCGGIAISSLLRWSLYACGFAAQVTGLDIPIINTSAASDIDTSSAASFASLVDHNGDGLLSFGEYMFFLTVLASECSIELLCIVAVC